MQENHALRFTALWNRIGGPGDARAVHANLVARYSETGRAYHSLEHIFFCLEEMDAVAELLACRDAVELALWFHDAVYDPRAKDNEERSAALLLEAAKGGAISEEIIHKAAALILETKHANPPENANSDASFTVDINLAILGQPAERFAEYEAQIRHEYKWVPPADFAGGRSAILRSFIARPSIYATEFFRSRYEDCARKNIEASLKAAGGVA